MAIEFYYNPENENSGRTYKAEATPAHAPGVNGHTPVIRAQIEYLQAEHEKMMGNLGADTRPEDAVDDKAPNPGENLYLHQAPKDYQNKRVAKKQVAVPPVLMRRGDQSGNYD